MPVNANILANMGTFSLPDTIKAAEQTKFLRVRNELLGYQADQEQAIAQRREKKREIEEMYAGMPARIAAYEELGMHEEAAQTREALLSGKRQEFAMFEIVAKSLDVLEPDARSGAWLDMRQQAIEAGMFDPEDMPDTYENGGQRWINGWLSKVGGELKVLETTFAELDDEGEETGRTMTRERVQQGGQIVEDNPPYESSSDKNARLGRSDQKPWMMKASDTNALLAQAKIQFDAILDDNGNFIGIRGEGDRALATLMEKASEIYKEGEGYVTHASAIAQAGREQGLKIKSTTDENANDPLGLLD